MSQKGGRKGNEARHIRLYYYFLSTPAWQRLSGNGAKVLIEICQLNNGSNNGAIYLSARETAKRTGFAINTSSKCLQELVEAGFIDIVEKGAFSRKTKAATTYRLSWLPVGNEVPEQSKLQRAPTHTYKSKAK